VGTTSNARRADLVRSDRRVMLVVFAVALLARLLPAVLNGGLRTWGTYDDGVYFAGADALIHGRIPYGQFVLLHPPGVLVVLAPSRGSARSPRTGSGSSSRGSRSC